MARPTKGLVDLVRDGTFRARHHRDRLVERDLPWPELAALQLEFRLFADEESRQRIGREFQAAVAELHAGPGPAAVIQAIVDDLGPRGSAEQAISFFERFFVWDDGSPFLLDDWQKAFLRDLFARDEHGRRVYKEILLGIPRGNGKTPLASGLSLLALVTGIGRTMALQAAGSKKQAALGTRYASDWIEDGDLAAALASRGAVVNRWDGRGQYAVVSSEGGLAHGEKPTTAVIDEWWLLIHADACQAVTAMKTALHKIADAYMLGISTAGYDKTSQLGEEYESALKLPEIEKHREGFLTIARDPAAGRLMWWFGMPDGYELDLADDAAVLRALELANPGSWVDHRELLRALRRAGDRHTEVLEWLRLNLNVWTKTKSAWVASGVWAGLKADVQIPVGADIYVAVDAAHRLDTTAVAWAWRAPDGVVHVRSKVWSALADKPAHEYVSTPTIDNEKGAEAFIRDELAAEYSVTEIVYDPNYFGTEANHLSNDGFVIAPVYPQSREMQEAVSLTTKAIADAKIAHDGDEVLEQHVEMTASEIVNKGTTQYTRLTREGDNTRRIDAAVAATMACWRALLAPENADYVVDSRPVEPEADADGDEDDYIL